MDEFLFAAFMAFAFLLRCLFFLAASTDDYWHLWKIREARRSGRPFHFNHVPSDAFAPGHHVYAVLHHAVISLFPERHWLWLGKILNIVYDLAGVIVVYALAAHTALADEGRLLGLPAAQWAAILYATSPVLLPITARLTSIGGRVIGNLSGLAYFIGIGWALHGGLLPGCLLAGVGVLVATLASQFGIQAIVLACLPLALLCGSHLPVTVVAATLALGLLVPGLGFWLILRSYWNFYGFYLKTYRLGTTAANRNRLRDFLALFTTPFRNNMEFLDIVFRRLTPVILVMSLPVLAWWAWWLVSSPAALVSALSAVPWGAYFSWICLIMFGLFLLTSFEPLVVFGQAERYMSYCVGFLSILSVAAVSRLGLDPRGLVVLLLVQLSLCFVNLLYTRRHDLARSLQTFHIDRCLREVLDFLEAQEGLRVLAIPTKMSFLLSFGSPSNRHRFYYDHMILPGTDRQYMLDVKRYYGLVRPDLDYFRERYGINTVVLKKNVRKTAAAQGIHYDLDRYRTLFENEEYAVYAL